MRPSLPTVKAAAASPNCSSCGPEAWVRRLSAATNSVSPAAAPRRAFSRPEVPARCEAVKSMVTTDSPKFSAVARMPAFCRSLNGKRGRSESHRRDCRRRPGLQPCRGQAVARGFHAHGQAVFVPVADRALAAGQALDRRVEPGVGVGDRLAAEPQPRNVGAIGFQADCVGAGHPLRFPIQSILRAWRPLWRISGPAVTGLRQWAGASFETAISGRPCGPPQWPPQDEDKNCFATLFLFILRRG